MTCQIQTDRHHARHHGRHRPVVAIAITFAFASASSATKFVCNMAQASNYLNLRAHKDLELQKGGRGERRTKMLLVIVQRSRANERGT